MERFVREATAPQRFSMVLMTAFASAAVLLIATVAGLACWLPAYRAVSVDPAAALRSH